MLSARLLSTFFLWGTTSWGQAAPEEPPPDAAEGPPSGAQEPAAPEAAEGEDADSPEEAPAPEGSESVATDGAEEAAPEEAAPEEAASEEVELTEAESESSDVEAADEDVGAATEEETSAEEARPKTPSPPGVPGSERPLGLGMAPEAPPVGPAAGGRAPSFGTPIGPDGASLTLSGNIAAWQTSGFGRRPLDATDEYEGQPIHVPPVVAGRVPFWREAELNLFITYGTPQVNATVGFFAYAGGREYQGYRDATLGPTFGQAYLTVAPNPIGNLNLRFVMGAFTEVYAGPGQWGWGIFGPLIAVRGYGESTHLDYSVSPKLRLTASAGVMGVPGVPEDFVRGNWTGWTETGVSTMAFHGHAGLNYAGKYMFRLHYAGALGTDEREYLTEEPRDGQMNVFAAEGHWYGVPWGHLGLSGGLWDFHDAKSVHDALWWGVKWTKGAQDMLRDYIGNQGRGNGKVVAASAEFNTSLARIAWHPRNFDGRSPDVRINLAGVAHRTLETDDPAFDGANGYLLGAEVEYQMLRWMSLNLRSYAENRSAYGDRWGAYNIAPGLAFRSDWQSTDRIELWYSRHFYSDSVDNNSAQPLDQHVLALGVFLGF